MKEFLRRQYREISAYGQAVLKNPKQPEHQFVVFFRPRAGSNLLIDLISSHPDVFCDDEIFGLKYSGKVTYPNLYRKGRWLLGAGKTCYGYKISYYQITKQGFDPKTYLQELHKQNRKIIYVERLNILRQAVSFLVAQQRSEWIGRADNQLRYKARIDCTALIAEMERIERSVHLEKKLLSPFPHLHLIYEQDLLISDKHQATCNRIFNFLALDSSEVKTQRVKTSKSNDLTDIISNYEDVKREVGGTRFACFLTQP
ncbi:MAG: hypothetical protein AAGM36_05625 [Cyanobacteria bacterium J06597_1]